MSRHGHCPDTADTATSSATPAAAAPAALAAARAPALPPEIYLIGCGTEVALPSQAAPRAMGFKAWNLARMAAL